MRLLNCIIPLLLVCTTAGAQQLNLPLSNDLNPIFERAANRNDSIVHTGMRPYVQSFIYQQERSPQRYGWSGQENIPTGQDKSWLLRKLRHESLVIVNDEDDKFYVAIDPVFNFETGQDGADTTFWADSVNFYKNTRGFRLHGHIGERFSFFSSFYENQAIFPRYQDAAIRSQGEWYNNNGTPVQFNGVVPGQGRTKQFKRDGFDYAMASGYISFMPHRAVNLQFGTGKHFIGEGYRSLLLSDNAFNYPYLRATSRWFKDKVQYTNIFASLSSLNRLPAASTSEALYQPKAGSFHYLTVVPHWRLQLGVFEGVMWQRWDTAASKPFNAAMLVPVLGFNTLVHGLEDDNNAMLGLTAKLVPAEDYVLYGQYIIDGSDKNGFQVGAKAADAFTIKNLFLQLEYNRVNPYTYGHTTPLQNYGHYNQALAHPLGAGFSETVVLAQYRWKDWWIAAKTNLANYNTDVDGTHLGRDIFRTEAEATDLANHRGITDLVTFDFRVGMLINPASNMNVVLGIIDRTESGPVLPTDRSQFIYAGFRTSLINAYYDF